MRQTMPVLGLDGVGNVSICENKKNFTSSSIRKVY